MKATKQYVLGDNSRLLVESLDTFINFENTFECALMDLYGDDDAQKRMEAITPTFDAVRRIIMDNLQTSLVRGILDGIAHPNPERITI